MKRLFFSPKKTKRSFTLLEVMIVIFIIGIIGSVIGYNMRGSMDEGKAFKTKEAISKVYNIVQMEISQSDMDEIAEADSSKIREKVIEILRRSGFVPKPENLVVDGWKAPLEFTYEEHQGEREVRMTSPKYEAFCARKSRDTEYPW